MRERLRKIAELAPVRRIVFLGQQPHVVAQRQQSLEEVARFLIPAEHCVIVRKPEAAGEERAFARREPVGPRSGVVTHHQSVAQEAALDRRDRAVNPGVVRRQEADKGNEQKAGVERRCAKKLDKGVARRIEAAGAHLLMDRGSDGAPALERTAEFELLDRAHCAIEGDPGHDLGMGEVLRTATNLPDSFVGVAPDLLKVGEERAFEVPSLGAGNEPRAARNVKCVEHFAVDVELELFDSGVADAHWARPFVTRQPGNLVLVEPTLARDAVHRLDVVRRTGDRAQKPLVPRLRLIEKACADQGEKRKRCVAKPTVPIIPVARTAAFLGQGRRPRGNDSAGLPMRERLQGQERTQNRVAPVFARIASRSPARPRRLNLLQRLCGWKWRGRGAEGRRPVQSEACFLSSPDREIAQRAETFAARRDLRIEQEPVGTRDELNPPVLLFRDPRNDGAVVEAHDELHPHCDLALQSADDANQVGSAVPSRHEIRETYGAMFSAKHRFENERVAQVSARDADVTLLRRYQPSPVLGFAKQRAEARAAVEAGQAQPVDRAVASNEREGLAIADDGVILDTAWHQGSDNAGERDTVSSCEGSLGRAASLISTSLSTSSPLFETIAATIANRPGSGR